MAQATESRSSSSSQPNIQDVFMNYARRERLAVTLHLLDGVRGEAETKALIVQENLRYARRQLIWFRKEPNLRWIPATGERPDTLDSALGILAGRS